MGNKSIKPKYKPIKPIELVKSITLIESIASIKPKSKSIKPMKSEFNLGFSIFG